MKDYFSSFEFEGEDIFEVVDQFDVPCYYNAKNDELRPIKRDWFIEKLINESNN